MRILYTTKTIYYLTLCAMLVIIANIAFGQTLTSDRLDYPPGDTAILTGSGFLAGETVMLQVVHEDDPGGTDSVDAHEPWSITADDDGNFVTTWYVYPDGDEVGASLIASADGQLSGLHAEALFTDAITPPTCLISGLLSGCSGRSLSFAGTTGTGLTYLWTITSNNTGASFAGSSTTQTVSVNLGNTPGTFVINLRVTSGAASSNCNRTITVNANPNVTVTGNASICSGNSSTLDAGAGYSSYLWSNGASTQSISVNAAGTYSVTVTNANGCSASTSHTLTVNANPSPAISGVMAVCSGASATFDAGSGYASYAWSSGENTQAISANTAGTYSVTVVDANGCSGSAQHTLTVNANPSPAISGAAAVCSGASATFDAGSGYASYAWSSGENTQAISANTAGTYSVTVVDANGCSGSAQHTLTVNANPSPAISGAAAVCSGASATFDAGAGYTSYAWSSGENTQAISANTAGTYSVTVVDANGCSGSAQHTLTVNANPSPAISGAAAVCSGASATFDAGSGYASYAWSSGENTQAISANTAGTYSVTVVDANGCSGSAQHTLTVNANPSPAISGAAAVCSGASATFDAGSGYTSYAWSSGENTQAISANTAGTYSVTVVDANGCSGSAQHTLTVNANPSPAISGAAAVCSGASATFDAGSGYTSYAWSSGENTQAISANTAGTYSVTVVDANGCSGSAQHTLTVNANPSPAISGAAAVCSGASATFDAGSGYASYAWSSGENTQAISANTAGTYSVTVVDANGCSGSAQHTLTVNANPSPAISGAAAVCSGASATFDAGAGYASYAWSSGATTQTISVNAAGTYSVTVTNSNGCNGSASRSFTVNANPTPAITGTNSVCSGASSTFDAGSGYASYAWSTGATTQTISVNTAGTYNVTVTNANGCNGSASRSFTVNANPTPAITGNNTVCTGASSTFDAGSGYTSYAWSTGATTQTISVNAAGTYSVTVTNSNGCNGSASRSFTVNANPSPAITGNNIVCSGSSSTFDADAGYTSYAWSTGATTQTISVNAAGTYSVTVTNANGCNGSASRSFTVNANPTPAITGTNIVCSGASSTFNAGAGYNTYLWSTGATTQTISVNAAGTYSVTVTNANGCNGSASRSLTINSATASASSNPGCVGTTLNLNSSGGNTYSWTGPNGFNSALQNPSISNITSAAAGTYIVTVTNASGCTATASTSVSVYTKPTASASSNSPVVGGNTLNLTSSGGTSYSWAGPNSFTSSLQNPSISNVTYLVAGTYTVTVSNSYGCTATTTTSVTITCSGFKSYTYTQGGWGAAPAGNNPAVYRNANFPNAFPSGLNVGCGSYWLHLTTSTAIQDFLPSGGSPNALTQSYTNPGSSLSNTLAGQVVALALNVGFDTYDANFAASTSMQLKDLYVKSGSFMGWTVLQVLNEAQKKLGGCTSSYTAAQLNTACTNINQNYDGGTTDAGFLSCMPVRIANASPVVNENSLSIYPNPTNGIFMLNLDLSEPISATVDIQIMNMLGQVIYVNQTQTNDGLLHQEVKFDNDLPNGNYLVHVISGQNIFTKQIIYQK